MYRKKRARKHLVDMSKQWFEKAYDPDSKEFYYVRRMDKQTRWDKPPFIAKDDDADLGIDSKKFLDRDEEIKFLKEQLAEKEKMIKHTEKARFQGEIVLLFATPQAPIPSYVTSVQPTSPLFLTSWTPSQISRRS